MCLYAFLSITHKTFIGAKYISKINLLKDKHTVFIQYSFSVNQRVKKGKVIYVTGRGGP
jgi:hypothetical protein